MQPSVDTSINPSGSDETRSPSITAAETSPNETEDNSRVTCVPGHPDVGVKAINGSRAKIGEAPANATKTMSNIIEIVFKPAKDFTPT
jgi:hypothetical protein